MLNVPELTVTDQIISLTRGKTANSKSPMWRCQTLDSQQVNVFRHADPVKDSFRLFEAAGYGEELNSLALGQKLRWSQYPIAVTLRLSGKWWEIVAVAPRPAGACPDPATLPNFDLYRRAAQRQAEALLTTSTTVVIWDSETTGLTDQDEIITLAAVDAYGETLLDVKLKPRDLSAVYVSSHIHGMRPADFVNEQTFPQLYDTIRSVLDGRIWVIYNAAFDTKMLDQMCRFYDCEPIRPVGVVDAIQLAAEFIGQWNFEKDGFRWLKLSEAAEQLGVRIISAHNALGDCLTTHGIVNTIADWQPPVED